MTLTPVEILVAVAFVIAGLVLSALYSGSETGLYTINRVRLDVRAAAGERRARWLQALRARPNRMLAVLLVGNNVANYLGSYGLAWLLEGAGLNAWEGIAVNAGLLIPLLFVFGEILPKDLFRTHTDRWTYAITGFLRVSAFVFRWTGLVPVIEALAQWALRRVGDEGGAAGTARERMSRLIKEGLGAGVLSEEQTTLADRALRLRSVTVADEMVRWARVVTLRADLPPAQRTAFLGRHAFSHLPVVDERGRILGVIAALDALLDPRQPTRALMEPPVLVPAHLPARDALQRMRRGQWALGIVVDAADTDGKRPRGLVTMLDLVEPLTGDLV